MATLSPTGSPSTFALSVVSQVKILAKQLQARGAQDGARRLEILSQQYQQFTVEGASQYIRKDEIIDELEENQPHRLLSVLRFFRNVFSIAPIVITWLALGLAASAYQSDLADSRYTAKDTYQSFLFLWQSGFHGNHGSVIPFSDAAYSDFAVLGILVILIIIIPIWEHRRRSKLHASLGSFDPTIDELLALIAKDGANAHLAESDVDKISAAVSEAIKEQLDRVMSNYNLVAIETRELVQDTHEKTNNVIQDFHKELLVYNTDIKLLNNSLQKMDTNLGSYGQKLTELTDASSKLAGSSNDLALNAKSMAESATLSSQASQGISNQLGALNTTQQEIVKTQKDVVQELATTQKQMVQDVTTSQQTVVQKIVDSQKEVVAQFTGAADIVEKSGQHTWDAAKELDRVANGLEQLTRADFQAMTDGVKQANQNLVNEVRKTSSEVQQVVGGLNLVNAQLQQTTQQLNATTAAFNAAAQTLATALAAQTKRRSWFW
ncbi:MAG TPA: hypothetical protein VGM01_04330 [Ktedonobacteraceae bacterium]|jgi:hypothetical protein